MTAVAHYWHRFQQYEHECASLDDAVKLLGDMLDAEECAPIGVVDDAGLTRPWSEFEDKWNQDWRSRL